MIPPARQPHVASERSPFMARTAWDPPTNPYTAHVRVDGGVLWLHADMWAMLEEITGARPDVGTPVQLLALLDGETARLSAEADPSKAAVAQVHLAELAMLREALLNASRQQF